MISCRGGLHDNMMLVSVLASARKFIGCPGTGTEKGSHGVGRGRGGEMRDRRKNVNLANWKNSSKPAYEEHVNSKMPPPFSSEKAVSLTNSASLFPGQQEFSHVLKTFMKWKL